MLIADPVVRHLQLDAWPHVTAAFAEPTDPVEPRVLPGSAQLLDQQTLRPHRIRWAAFAYGRWR